jgi:glutamate/tyrosine decarboxylase-like PLP-dependent enzyme
MAETMGYPKQAVGNLTSGGSIANLTGIVCWHVMRHPLEAARDFEKSGDLTLPQTVFFIL